MKYQRENLQLAEGLRCARLSAEQCQKIHDATLEVMEQVGARLYSQEALDIMAKAGVPITDGNRVHVPIEARGVGTEDRAIVHHDL